MRLLCCLALVFSAATAAAHGRAAYAVSLSPHPTSGRVLAGTTYGLLLSRAEGFHWICEQALDYEDQFDPRLSWGADGTMFAALPDQLMRSSDDGCDWKPVAEFAATGASHIGEDPTAAGTYWATTAKFGQLNSIRASTNGVTFEAKLSRPSTYFSAVAVAPSNGQRIYATAWFSEPLEAWLFRSDDRGASFAQLSPILPGKSGFKLLAVSPADQQTLFATVYDPQAQAVVLRSTDGGASWTALFSTDDIIRGAHVSADGLTAFIASARKLYRSTDAGASFTEVSGYATNACIAGRDGELFICGRPPGNPFVVGTFSLTDSSVTPKLIRNEDILGPLQCPAGTSVGDVCEAQWPLTAPLLNIPLRSADGGVLVEGEEPEPRTPACGCATSDSGAAHASALVAALMLLTAAARGGGIRRRSKQASVKGRPRG